MSTAALWLGSQLLVALSTYVLVTLAIGQARHGFLGLGGPHEALIAFVVVVLSVGVVAGVVGSAGTRTDVRDHAQADAAVAQPDAGSRWRRAVRRSFFGVPSVALVLSFVYLCLVFALDPLRWFEWVLVVGVLCLIAVALTYLVRSFVAFFDGLRVALRCDS